MQRTDIRSDIEAPPGIRRIWSSPIPAGPHPQSKDFNPPKPTFFAQGPKLSIFAIQGLGDDPIRATGALLLDLPSVINAVEAGRSGVFWLRPRVPQPKDSWDLLKELADRRQEDVGDLYRQVAVSDDELAAPVLVSAQQ